MAPRASFPTECFLLPDLADWTRWRLRRLGLRFSTYALILLRNEVLAGKPGIRRYIPSGATKQVRERFSFSIPSGFANQAVRYANQAGGTFSQLVEALVVRDRLAGREELIIWPVELP